MPLTIDPEGVILAIVSVPAVPFTVRAYINNCVQSGTAVTRSESDG